MKLAINGGDAVRTKPFPTVNDLTGRDLGEEERKLLIEVIDSGHLNRVGGTKVIQLEKEFASKYKVKHAIASTSGTASLHIALGALNLNPGDEIITTSVTDMGTVFAVLLCNLVPIFADVNPLTCNISHASIKEKITEKTKAIIPVHLFGQPADMDPILKLAREYNLYVIEDCCQAHLAEYKGKFVGTIGNLGCFSFQQSKQMTTGDGGMTITSDDKFAERARLFADKGWPRESPGRGHLFLGPNYRMTELQGAVGLAQIRKIDSIVQRRRKSAEMLTELIKGTAGIIPPKIIDGITHSWWMYSFTIDKDVLNVSPNEFKDGLNKEGIPFYVGYLPHPIFSYEVIREKKTYGISGCPWECQWARKGIEYKEEDYPGVKKALKEIFVMGWNEGITEEDVRDIARGLQKVAEYYRKSR